MENNSIRVENERGYSTVESLVRESFWNVYRSGCTEHYVLHHLRSNPDFIPELAFVMEADFFLCKELKPGYLDGITGVYATPKSYFVAEENPEDFEAFDAGFRMK